MCIRDSCKSPDDKHKLVVDDYAAEVVRGIFSLKFQGYNQQAIADFLDVYKRQFHTHAQPWAISEAGGISEKEDNPALLPIQIAYYTGLRIGEVCGLTWQDVNLDKQYLTVRCV